MRSTLPLFPEIRLMVLEALLELHEEEGFSLARFAAVSEHWRGHVERYTFARIRLTPSRLLSLNAMVAQRERRALVRYLWFCIELTTYDCSTCNPRDDDAWESDETECVDHEIIVEALQTLFSTLSSWEAAGQLSLDISVYSSSDPEHWFKYLTFEPDTPLLRNYAQNPVTGEATLSNAQSNKRHKWVPGFQTFYPPEHAMDKLFYTIMEGLGDHKSEREWWEQLPLVPAVTSLLIRQENRRRWRPRTIAEMITRFPRLQELVYEPWRQWQRAVCTEADHGYQFLIASITSSKLRKLAIFENFKHQYALSYAYWPHNGLVRIPCSTVGNMLSGARHLESLSASFMVEAGDFFAQIPPTTWPNLTSLTLTSQLLHPDQNSTKIMNLFLKAAQAALHMPSLQTMEMWHGRQGLAALFKYEVVDGQSSVITWRRTWDLDLQNPVISEWEAVANNCHDRGIKICDQMIDGKLIKSHGDAIHYLRLSESVIRPVSLKQIRREHELQGVMHFGDSG